MFDNMHINNDYFKVFSLTQSRDHSLMWAHYAGEHEGICIGYDFDYLPANIAKERVVYKSDCLEGNKAFKHLISYLQTKDDCWSYEKEARLLYFGDRDQIKYCFDKSTALKRGIISLKVNQIVLGLNFNESSERILAPIIKEIEKSQKQKIKFFKAHNDKDFPLKLQIKDHCLKK